MSASLFSTSLLLSYTYFCPFLLSHPLLSPLLSPSPSPLFSTTYIGGKASAPSKPGGGLATPKKPAWTKEDEMARKIQTHFRGYRLAK